MDAARNGGSRLVARLPEDIQDTVRYTQAEIRARFGVVSRHQRRPAGTIWERIYDTETYSHPPLQSTCPEWDVNCREFLTYPNEGKQQWRLTDLVWHQNGLPNGEDLAKRSAGDSQALIEPLGLPALPSPIFCYYVDCKWAWSLISRHRAGTGRKMNPLMKAAILKQIKLF
jgi:hypothetical protein